MGPGVGDINLQFYEGGGNAFMNSVVQRLSEEGADVSSDPVSLAQAGVQGPGSALPHAEAIQSSFGHHDVSGVRSHDGGATKDAAGALGATAYATGNDVAFTSAPDMHTAAHEAAHVVQQNAGVQLKGGMGSTGDKYEKNADSVADAVVQGKSAEGQLDAITGKGGGSSQAVQCTGHEIGKPLPEGAAEPEHLNTDTQRQYSVEQYVEMWEKERGTKMTAAEQDTLARGCIGITAIELNAGNPPLEHAYSTFEQAMAVVNEWNAFIQKHKNRTTSDGPKVGDFKAVLFAKMFWSNQSPDQEERKKPDDSAYKPDEDGKIDMSDYKYRAQPGFVNFDYGFWDAESNCFWHANHAQPDMKVYQSTKEKFIKGYDDFDRITFHAAITRTYKPAAAALSN